MSELSKALTDIQNIPVASITKRETCNCWSEKDDGLRKMGYKISDACSMLSLNREALTLSGKYGLPLQRIDGAKPKRSDPKMITITHCPFCGAALDPSEE